MIYCEELFLKGNFKMVIETFSFCQRPNEHSTAFVNGYINPEDITELNYMDSVTICTKTDEILLFAGVIKEYVLKANSGIYALSLEIVSGTYLMDREKRTVSYQKKQSYRTLLDKIIGDQAQAMYFIQDQMVEGLLVQYEETDWEFIKRLVSHFETFVIPEVNHSCEGRVFIGLRNGISIENMQVHNYVELFDSRYFMFRDKNAVKQMYINYRVESCENHSIGDYVLCNNRTMQICEKEAVLLNGILNFNYLLSEGTYFKTKRQHNTRLHGKEIAGTVKKTEGELLKVQLKTDHQPFHADFYYPWMPETGNLMYCMPEPGTDVTLYFCDDSEQSAVCINCIRKNSKEDKSKWKPQDKRFFTHEHQVLELKKEKMEINTLDSYLTIDEDIGIVIKTTRALEMRAERQLTVEGELVIINSEKEIGLIKEDMFDPTVIVLKNDFDFKGKTARIEPKIWYGDKEIPSRIFNQGKDLEHSDLEEPIMGMIARR